MAVASSYAAPLIVKVNGVNITNPITGASFPNPSNATIRKGIHGAFGDLRFTFPSSLLNAGDNVISFTQRKAGGDIQYDYLRLESPIPQPLTTTSFAEPAVKEVRVYPNPFLDTLTIQLRTNPLKVEVQITSIDGKTVYQKQFINPEEVLSLNVAQLRSGNYVLKLTQDNHVSFYEISK